jgi:hypothetical protein
MIEANTDTLDAPAPVAPAPTVILEEPAAKAPPAPASSPALAHLAKIADGYFASGAVRQATELYFEILEDHPDTPEAGRARERLMAIAETYEKAHATRQARTLYERLL